MEQVREEQVWRTVCTGVPKVGAAARGRRGWTESGVGQPRRATGFRPDSGRSDQDMGHQGRENSDWSAETIRQSQEATSGNQEMRLERLRRKEELEKQRIEELAKQEREELEKKEREPENRQREKELERQRREEQTESNKLLEQEIREWEREQQERAAELEKQKRQEQLQIQKREAELERRKQEVEQKSLTIEKEQLMFRKEVDSEQAKELELQRQKREKREEELEAEGKELELEKQRREEEMRERKRKEVEKLERQRREEEEKHRREEEIKRKRRDWELKKREHEEKLERERQQWAQEKQKQEEELRKLEMEEALKKAEELRKQNIRMEREKELQREKQMERDLNDIEHINVEVKTFKGDVTEKTQTLPDLVRALYEVADAIDEDHRAATLAGCAGAGMSVAGGVVAISGAVLAPFTGGASLVATVGVGGSFLGSVTRIVGGVKQKLDNTKRERTVDEILGSCHQLLQNLEHNYNQIENKIKELEKKPLKDNYRTALERIKRSFLDFAPALTTEIFQVTLKSLSQLTGRLLSRMVVEKVSQEVSHVATTEAAKEVTKRMTQETTSYFSYEAIKEFLTFSGKEVSKKWYQDVAITSALASGAAALLFLPSDAKDFYRDATHITKGAKSEIAEEIRNFARALEKLIDCLNEHL